MFSEFRQLKCLQALIENRLILDVGAGSGVLSMPLGFGKIAEARNSLKYSTLKPPRYSFGTLAGFV